jgi:NAD(P)-dependent dehydrogenase (short-subunit alcohol dehydrogenase family)/mannose-6-phosphate isomerase-like protein (cupin superfamily)
VALVLPAGKSLDQIHRDTGYPVERLKFLTGNNDAKRPLTEELRFPDLPACVSSAEATRLPQSAAALATGDPMVQHRLQRESAVTAKGSVATLPAVRPGVIRAAGVEELSFVEGIKVKEVYNTARDPERSLAQVSVDPGMTTALHWLDVFELQRIVSGSGRVVLGGAPPQDVTAGDVVVIPPGTTQRITNTGSTPLLLDCICTGRFVESAYHHLEDPVLDEATAARARLGDVVAVVPIFEKPALQAHQGQVAVVTGGYGGIGLETCRQLGRQGFSVVLTGRGAAAGRRAAAALEGEGLSAVFQPLDVTNPDSVKALATFVEDRYGRADVLVNCAGIALDPPGVDLAGRSKADVLAATFAVNTYGPMRVTDALLPLLRRTPGGARVINVSSELATSRWSGEGYAAYRSSKAALNLHTQDIARELNGTGVVVNAIDPGWVKTRMGGADAIDTTLEGVQALLWLATTEDPPTGGFFRRSKTATPPDGMVAIEKEAW